MFTVGSDVEELATRSEDISMDYDFFHSDIIRVACGGDYSAVVTPRDINVWMDKMAIGLEKDGVLTGAGGQKWHTSTINKILRNEKYIGYALLQKTYTTDFLTKKRIKNNGTVSQYYVENNHEGIIPRDLYMLVQEELVRRRVVHTSRNGKKRSYSCNHCFAQIVFCGECGEMYRRIHWNNRGVKSIVWRCISRLEGTEHACHSRTVNELLLQDITTKAINQTLGGNESLLKTLQENIAATVKQSDCTSADGIDKQLEECSTNF